MSERRRLMGKKKELDIRLTEYLCFTAIEAGTFTLTVPANLGTSDLSYIEYSTNNGATWIKTNNSSSAVTITTPTIQANSKILWRGSGNRTSNASSVYSKFSSTAKFDVSGNIMSLIHPTNFWEYSSLTDYCFQYLFYNCSNLVSASDLLLPATTLANYCYNCMFRSCKALTSVPELPARTVKNSSYAYMFYGCTKLKTAQSILPATSLGASCYSYMFYGCSILSSPPALPALVLNNSCYMHMFHNCSRLVHAPVLPALTLVSKCYEYMFYKCTWLLTIKAMFTTTPGTSYTKDWVYGCNQTQGTYTKNSAATYTSRGTSCIPSNWTIETASS